MKLTDRWYSARLEQEVGIARWGQFGTPVLIFPTAGGDCEEIERFHVIDALSELIEEGRIKVYSCDSVAGRASRCRSTSRTSGASSAAGWARRRACASSRTATP